MSRTIRKLLFYIFLLILTVSFFASRSYRGVREIEPELLSEPKQVEIQDPQKIEFEKDGFGYEITPLFEYEINGLVVHTFDYSFLGIYDTGSLFPVDLCLIWGSNLSSKVYQNKSLKFSQDYRWCNYRWRGNLEFNGNEVSNNHLLIIDENLRRKAKSINPGDQVRVAGKLVNVLGESIDGGQGSVSWKSSVSREDSGAGGCEVIFVESLEVLKEAHSAANFFIKFSLAGIAGLLTLSIFLFVKGTYF